MARRQKRPHSANLMKDIAERCQVTNATVSNVLRNAVGGRASAETRKRVYREAIASGYHTRWDQRIDSSRKHIAFVFPDRAVVYQGPTIFHSILEELREREEASQFNFQLYVMDREKADQTFYRAVCEDRTDAVLLLRYGPAPMVNELAARLPVPLIYLERNEGVVCSSVGSDSYEAGRMVAEHLHGEGYRSFAALGDPHYAHIKRLPGFFDALTELGVPESCQRRFDSGTDLQAGKRMAKELLASEPELPVGIFCNSDIIALGAQLGCYEAGFRPDRRIGLVGCDNQKLRGTPLTDITSIDWNPGLFAETLIEILKDTFAGKSIQHRVIPSSLVKRKSSLLRSGTVPSLLTGELAWPMAGTPSWPYPAS